MSHARQDAATHDGSIEDVHSDHRLKREFSLWSAFAFAFAFISPIVALYLSLIHISEPTRPY
jgi:hypothetical protein